MEKIKLHYASILNEGDIPCINFETPKNLVNFLEDNYKSDEIVYVFAYEFSGLDGKQEVFVTEDLTMIAVILENCYNMIQTDNVFFLQEYSSFEEAYKVALDMQETSLLCYKKIGLNNNDSKLE